MIAIGCDHAGFELKEKIKEKLREKGISFEDVGTHSSESCDYPDFAEKVAGKVGKGEHELGILVCGTGIGMGMAANKFKGARAAVCHNTLTARMAREHNNANVLCIGARVMEEKTALKTVDVFLGTDFSEGERHKRRVEKIEL